MRKVDRFSLGEVIGGTDTATLHAATETFSTGATRAVLLKEFAPPTENPAAGARFAAEVQNLAAIGPAAHVLTLYAAGVTDNTPWIACEPAASTLVTSIQDVPASAEQVSRMLEDVLDGLVAVHARNLLHNDIKPANVIILPGGAHKLAELSLASTAAAEITQQADTIRYAAPEIFARDFGKVSPSTDLYALGHIAYEMALGSRQWRGQFPAVFEPGQRTRDPVNPAKWMAWHCSTTTTVPGPHELLRSFPPALGQVMLKLMAKDPRARYESAAAALAAVQSAVRESAKVVVTDVAPTPTAPRPSRRSDAPAVSEPAPAPRPAPVTPPSPPPAPAGPRYFVRLRGRQSGPFDLPTLQRQARTGQLSRLHQISTDGTNWRPVTTIDGLFGG